MSHFNNLLIYIQNEKKFFNSKKLIILNTFRSFLLNNYNYN